MGTQATITLALSDESITLTGEIDGESRSHTFSKVPTLIVADLVNDLLDLVEVDEVVTKLTQLVQPKEEVSV